MTYCIESVHFYQCHHRQRIKVLTDVKITNQANFHKLDLYDHVTVFVSTILIVILWPYCGEKHHVTDGLLEVFAILRWLGGSSRTSRHRRLISSPVSPGISSSAGLKWQNPLRYWFISANAASGRGYERYSYGLTRLASPPAPFMCTLGSQSAQAERVQTPTLEATVPNLRVRCRDVPRLKRSDVEL